jgi:hypothetical protein
LFIVEHRAFFQEGEGYLYGNSFIPTVCTRKGKITPEPGSYSKFHPGTLGSQIKAWFFLFSPSPLEGEGVRQKKIYPLPLREREG